MRRLSRLPRSPRLRRVVHNGFTLLKMLVVVAMIGMLAGLALYGVRQSHVR